jgi:enoyl-CoA hydratase/carnithine racemase
VTELANLVTPDQARSLILRVWEAGQAIRETPVPTIAQIEGRCFGAGLELAASCDFRYALKGSLFAMPEVELGVSHPHLGNIGSRLSLSRVD